MAAILPKLNIDRSDIGDDGEIITVREALTRIGLEELIPGEYAAADLVLWRGYPKPFACGHVVNEQRSCDGVAFTTPARVNQSYAGGAVLFSFPLHRAW
jgi:hypothetical protein